MLTSFSAKKSTFDRYTRAGTRSGQLIEAMSQNAVPYPAITSCATAALSETGALPGNWQLSNYLSVAVCDVSSISNVRYYVIGSTAAGGFISGARRKFIQSGLFRIARNMPQTL